MPNTLIGNWISDPEDTVTLQEYGNVIMEFKENGELIYSIVEKNKEQKILMTYQVSDNLLITEQPSVPQKETTVFILSEHILELYFDGVKSQYIKINSNDYLS